MNKWVKHLGFWCAVYVIWAFMKMGVFDLRQYGLINLGHVLAYISIFYALRLFLIPKFYDKGRPIVFVLATLGWTCITLVIWYLSMLLLSKMIHVPDTTIPDSIGGFILEAIQFFVPGMFLLAWESYQDRMEEEEKAHLLKKEKLSNELKLLKAQVNPDLLLNTLKHLRSFVSEKSIHAPDMIMRLSGILDYILYRSQKDEVPLSDELNATNDLIALQKIRLGDSLDSKLVVEGNLTTMVSPLSIFSLVENVFKNWEETNSKHLKLHARVEEDREQIACTIKVSDEKRLLDVGKENYTSNMKRRLALTYPGRNTFALSKEDDWAVTSMTLIPKHG